MSRKIDTWVGVVPTPIYKEEKVNFAFCGGCNFILTLTVILTDDEIVDSEQSMVGLSLPQEGKPLDLC